MKIISRKKHSRKNEINFKVNTYLEKILPVDICQIHGFSDETALTLFAETGGKISSFRTANHFVSWIGLAPKHQIIKYLVVN